MEALYDFLSSIFEYIYELFCFSVPSSSPLPPEVITLIDFVPYFFMWLTMFYYLYFCFNFLFFLFSLGGVRRK